MVMIWYVLITTGPRPAGNINHLKAAQRQLDNLRAFDWREAEIRPRIFHDYARQVKDLSSVPALHRLLAGAASGGGLVFMDDPGRLFARCKQQDRGRLHAALSPFGGHLYSLRWRRKFCNLSEEQLRATVVYPDGRFRLQPRASRLPAASRHQQTEDARAASLPARRDLADAHAWRLHALGQALQEGEIVKVTPAMIARAANRQGVLTARGGTWSSSTVARMLRRLDAGQAGPEAQ